MMNVYREILPDSYLLILTDSEQTLEPEPLQRALQRASGSGKANVWIDCSELHHPSTAIIQLLGEFYLRLRHQHIQLVLCHLEEVVQQEVLQLPAASQPVIVATLLDASLYCRNLRTKQRSAA
ncbi:STAS domain-containing protein [Hymenobacter tibetensis]|uniref:STAS domain-containing protein n=1 Tax=Hymenobacter tibetensis TaxID=497967 RepID=A0ABY4CXW3_9BACT|nr:STAS domain-containing protein [Hymenobacter tibetensis]UOG74577.1 STAS domain-containing protein [Hymenobacter tibetensis]